MKAHFKYNHIISNMFIKFCAFVLLLNKYVSGQTCTSDSVYVVGADYTLGFAGGVSGFPGLDGCYTFEPSVSVVDGDDDEIPSAHGVFLKEGLYTDGPQLGYVTSSTVWYLSQMDYDTDPDSADYSSIGEHATAISTEDSPADVTNWGYVGQSADITVRCGCSDTSPFEVTCRTLWINDGECDTINNNPECAYDGGDCCECTCTDTRCGGGNYPFNCLNPEVDCGSETPTPEPSSSLWVESPPPTPSATPSPTSSSRSSESSTSESSETVIIVCVAFGFCFVILLLLCLLRCIWRGKCVNGNVVSQTVDVDETGNYPVRVEIDENGNNPMGVEVDENYPVGVEVDENYPVGVEVGEKHSVVYAKCYPINMDPSCPPV